MAIKGMQFEAGDLTVTSGNINMATTTSSVGVYNINSTRFMHNYNLNVFLGSGTGNFTLNAAVSSNVAVGSGNMRNLTTGDFNTSIGAATLSLITSGSINTGLGSNALEVLTTGGYNTAVGGSALTELISGSGNIAIGSGTSAPNYTALGNLLTGSYNIAIGSYTGAINTGAGANYTGAESSNILLGSATSGTLGESNIMRLGTSGSGNGQVNKCFIAGSYGITPAGATQIVVMDSNGQMGTSATAGGTAWSVITANQTAAVANGYFCNKASALSLALPTTSAVGDVIEVSNINTALGVLFTQAANQQIFIGNTSTTLGVGGTLASSSVGDSLKIVCRTANLVWYATSMIGNWTPV